MGRDDHLAVLFGAVRRARDGAPSVVLLSGETGVGKSRLVREVAERSTVTLLYGGCVPVAGDPLPFAPLTQALRRLQAEGTVNLQLSRLPDLARLLPGHPTSGGSQPASVDGTASSGSAQLLGNDLTPASLGPASQLALFQSVLTLVDRLGAFAPVLYVIEDVQWADRSTLDLVRFLATNLTRERVAIVLTCRPEDVPASSQVAGWFAELSRLGVTERVAVDRLAPRETAVLVGALLSAKAAGGRSATSPRGALPDTELVAQVAARSDGNPLFAEQLVMQGDPDPTAPLPATLRELLTARVQSLPATTRRLLDAAAVLGRPADVEVLARTAGSPVEQVEDDLLPALDADVVRVRLHGVAGTVGFRHPAFAEAVYGAVLPTRRARLHRSAAEALEWFDTSGLPGARDSADALSGELARHWLGAGDSQRALDASVAAGYAAERMFAFADAHSSFRRAADLLDELPEPQGAYDGVRLLKHAAQDASLIGESVEATRLLDRALAQVSDQATRASLCARLGQVHYRSGHARESEARFREALTLLPPEQESVLVARIYAGLALLGAAWSRLDDADAACRRGLDVARKVGARREEGLLLNARGVAASARGQGDEAVGYLREALAVARAWGNPNDLSTAHINLSHVLGEAGRVDDCVAAGAEAAKELTRVGLARQSGSLVKANVSGVLIQAGRLGEASQIVTEALSRHPRGVMAAPVLMRAGQLAMIGGELEDAWEYLEQARIVVESENAPVAWLREVVELAAEVELWAGRPEAAYELAVDGLHLVRDTAEEDRTGVLVGLGLRALANQAETKRDSASRSALVELADPLEDARSVAELSGPDAAALSAWQDAEDARLNRCADGPLWARAASLWQRLGRPYPQAYTLWREAEARLESKVDVEGITALRRAHDGAVRLGARRLVDEVEQLATWYRLDLVAPAAEAEADGLSSYRLTPRELEVLDGLAEGRTNQEIADHLVISVKTASVHVTNILRKLDVSGRQEAARVAHRAGLGR